jgi:peptidoglycan/LPS O-acetylase OafA/YrhL
MISEKGRNHAVDLLRGISIIIVAMSHTVGFMTWDFLPGLSNIPALQINGYYGVCIFFGISGFLIAQRLMALSALPSLQFLRTFYTQRVGRIAPCLLLVLLAGAIIDSRGVPRFTFGPDGFSNFAFCIATFTYNHCILQGGSGLPDGWNALWSLAVEEVFYLFFPLLMLITLRSRRGLTAALVVYVLAAPFYRWHWLVRANVYSYLGNFDLMAMGILVAMHGRALSDGRFFRWLGLIGLMVVFFSTVSVVDSVWAPSAIGFFTGLYLLGAMAKTGRTALLRPLRFAGVLSYEMYLFHLPILGVVVRPFYYWALSITPNHPIMLTYACMVVYWGSLSLVAFVIANYFANPANRIIRHSFAPSEKMVTIAKPDDVTAPLAL